MAARRRRNHDPFDALSDERQHQVLEFLESLVLFPPQDTASNLGYPGNSDFPQFGHGSIALRTLFNDREDQE